MSNDRLLTDAHLLPLEARVNIIADALRANGHEAEGWPTEDNLMAREVACFDAGSAKTAAAMQADLDAAKEDAGHWAENCARAVDAAEAAQDHTGHLIGDVLCAGEALDALRAKGQALAEALQLALNAFEKNWAIDWGELDAALADWSQSH